MKMSVRGLGDIGHQLDELLSPSMSVSDSASGLDLVESALIYKLRPGRSQPRKIMRDETLVELAKSIQEHGIIQPIVVLPKDANGEFEIIAGERRWRAARLANLQEVPVIIRQFDENKAIAVSLIENIQREDLNVLDYIKALHRLSVECSLTHEQIAKVIGKSRVAVTNLLRLLQLDDELLALLSESKLDVGHARCLLSLPVNLRHEVAQQVQDKGLSVRETERLVNVVLRAHGGEKKASVSQDLQWQSYRDRVSYATSMPVKIRKGRGRSINIELNCKDSEQLEKLIKLLEGIS